jgi:hypothetical protein
MTKRVSVLLVVFALLVVIAGCSKPPEAEINAANAAIEVARTAEAELYAPDALRKATDSLNAANAEKTTQDGKFALFRSYGKSKEMFVQAEALAKAAAGQAETEKEKVRQQVMEMLTTAQAAIDSTGKALAKAPVGKGNKADIELIKNDLAGVQAAFDQAKADYDGGKYMSARGKLEAVMQQASSIQTEIANAVAKKAGK